MCRLLLIERLDFHLHNIADRTSEVAASIVSGRSRLLHSRRVCSWFPVLRVKIFSMSRKSTCRAKSLLRGEERWGSPCA
jgi:hypothetical protein